ncbi:MAG: hypothetical protein FWD78_02940 [Treponema sp.]|nr:hypothetical protein [Treponema sp.]
MAEPVTGNAQVNGLTDAGDQQPGNVNSLKNAFAGAGGVQPDSKPGTQQNPGDTGKGDDKSSGSNITLGPWAQQLPPEIRDNPELAGRLAKFTKVPDLAMAYLDMEGKLAAGTVPDKDAGPEEVAAFWEKAGKPKTLEGYKFSKDKENRGEEFAQVCLEANLTVAQADAMFKSLGDLGNKSAQKAKEAWEQQFKETETALEKEYGSRFPEKMELLKRGLTAAGPNVSSLLAQTGLSSNPEIIKAFITYGELTSESGAARGSGAGTPLKSIFDGGTFEYTN